MKGDIFDAFKFKLIVKSPCLIGICLLIALYAISITFVEIQQAEIVERTLNDPISRTRLFSSIDFAVNVLALIIQLFITSRLIERFGFRFTLLFVPVGITIGFAIMAVTSLLAVMVGVEIFRRSGDYAIMKPAREMLFSVVSREEKYKAKNFIDTAILRGGNASSALAYKGLQAIGVAGAGMAGASLALGLAWCGTAYWLAGQFNRKQSENAVDALQN